jgi:hypothetical protein
MTFDYSAFGMDLHSEFPLPGMTPRTPSAVRSLSLRLTTPAELLEQWSGDRRTARWRGRLGDGQELSIARGPSDDLLFGYGDRAHFHLDPAAKCLECAPTGTGRGWRRTLLARILPNVRLAHGFEALHASAVASSRGVVAITGPSGAGKTTLALELMRRGMSLVGDDVLMLSTGPSGVLGHPATPHMNVDQRAPVPVEHGELARFGGERWIEVFDSAPVPQRVDGICLLQHDTRLSLAVEPLPGTPLLLAPYMLGLPDDDAGRERRRFELYSNLTERCPLVRMTRGADDSVEQLADALQAALGSDRLAMQGAL